MRSFLAWGTSFRHTIRNNPKRSEPAPEGVIVPAAPAIALQPGFTSALLEGVSPSGLRVILGAAKQRRYFGKQILIHEGDSATCLYLLTSGRARHCVTTEQGKRLLLRWLGPGDAFGVQTLVPRPRFYQTNTEMVKEGNALVWDRATIQDLSFRYPVLLANALAIATEYLAKYHTIHVGLTSHTAQQRLAETLVELSQSIGRVVPGGVELHIKNAHLADMAHVNLFTTSRVMSEWQRRGAISKSRGIVLLLSGELLLKRI